MGNWGRPTSARQMSTRLPTNCAVWSGASSVAPGTAAMQSCRTVADSAGGRSDEEGFALDGSVRGVDTAGVLVVGWGSAARDVHPPTARATTTIADRSDLGVEGCHITTTFSSPLAVNFAVVRSGEHGLGGKRMERDSYECVRFAHRLWTIRRR